MSSNAKLSAGTQPSVVFVGEGGAIRPQTAMIPRGGTVEWRIPRGQAILPVDYDPVRKTAVPRPYLGEADDFTGPLVRAVPGIHVINQPRDDVDPLPDWVWEEPGFTCAYVRLEWAKVNPAAGEYDWDELTGYMDHAVRAGKYFGVSVKAGVQATPRWLFSAALGDDACEFIDFEGINRDQGLPWDPNFKKWYFAMMRSLARHIRSNNGWWQRLASIHISGANYHSAEARLPNRKQGQSKMDGPVDGVIPSEPDCDVWERRGYTPEKLYGFYTDQCEMLVEQFPGKDICYPLIQAGFPRANADDPTNLPRATEQTDEIIRRGRRMLGSTWIVQHLGLQARPDEEFPGDGWHPIVSIPRRGEGEGRYKWVGSGFPNSWALGAGIDGSPTAWQTVNRLGQDSFESAIENAWFNSDGLWLEVYAKDVKPSFDAGSGPVGPSGLTLAEWSRRFYDWRVERWGEEMGDPFPAAHRHTFPNPGRYAYVLGTDPKSFGIVVVE